MINLMHGDCLELMGQIPDGSVDMILCDLPYGTTQNKWDSVIPFEPLWAHYKRVTTDNAAIVLFAQTPFDKVLGCSNMPWLRYELVWEKTHASGHMNAKKMPMKAHENILVFYNKLPTYNPLVLGAHDHAERECPQMAPFGCLLPPDEAADPDGCHDHNGTQKACLDKVCDAGQGDRGLPQSDVEPEHRRGMRTLVNDCLLLVGVQVLGCQHHFIQSGKTPISGSINILGPASYIDLSHFGYGHRGYLSFSSIVLRCRGVPLM